MLLSLSLIIRESYQVVFLMLDIPFDEKNADRPLNNCDYIAGISFLKLLPTNWTEMSSI